MFETFGASAWLASDFSFCFCFLLLLFIPRWNHKTNNSSRVEHQLPVTEYLLFAIYHANCFIIMSSHPLQTSLHCNFHFRDEETKGKLNTWLRIMQLPGSGSGVLAGVCFQTHTLLHHPTCQFTLLLENM